MFIQVKTWSQGIACFVEYIFRFQHSERLCKFNCFLMAQAYGVRSMSSYDRVLEVTSSLCVNIKLVDSLDWNPYINFSLFIFQRGFVEAHADDGLLEIFGLKQGWHASFVMVELVSAKHIAQVLELV